ncbi:hypothetical protein [Propioniciclava soli]|uniref:FtsX extracellular domain-containing protein n=1 Tax=Propioniciclava soli TaxID=2775081 RepID=A0ABZ3C3G2_9ACTN|nr:hypothetical protein [Propioniciclava soli]
MSEEQLGQHPKRRWVLPLALVAVIMVGGFGIVRLSSALVTWSDASNRGKLDLVAEFVNSEPNPDWPYLDTEDRTAQVCAAPVDCVQAVGNEYLTLLKFDDVDQARRYADSLGPDGHRIDPLVLHFDGTPVTAQAREEVIATVSGINASSPD